MNDSHALKITGKVELAKALDNDKNYRIAIEWSITNISTSPNGDWTYSNTYSLRPVHVLIHDELGSTIKARDPRSNSTKLRSLLKFKYEKWEAWDSFKEFNDFYDSFYSEIYKNLDFLLSKL